MKKRKTNKVLDEASYYTGQGNGQSTPEATSAYEFARDSVPTLNKIADLKNKGKDQQAPAELPFPLQNSLSELADLYIKAQDLRNKARSATELPFFKGREAELDKFRTKLNGIMVECKKLAASLSDFSLAPRE